MTGTTISTVEETAGVGVLRDLLDGEVVLPGDADWDAARQAWNLSADQRPAAVVDYARRRGMRVTTQGTGHFAGTLEGFDNTILIRTCRMRGLEIDPETQTARAEAGVLWEEVSLAAAEHGLVGLAGSSPDVGGIVTAIEFSLYPVPEVYAGVLFFPVERASEVLKAWREWVDGTPDEVTSVGRLMSFPPFPMVPERLRGQSFVLVEATYIGDETDGAALIQPLRELGPVMDTFAVISVEELRHLHMDPPTPVPGAGDGMALVDVTPETIDALVEVAGAGSGSPLLSVELRQLGGAVAEPSPDHGAVGTLDAGFAMFGAGMAPDPETKEAVEAYATTVKAALSPWAADRGYFNFADRPQDGEALYPAETYRRLAEIKADVDPEELFRATYPIRPALETVAS